MEIKDVLKSLGIPETVATVEELVAEHNKSFIPLSEAHTDERVVEKLTGKIYGLLNTDLKKMFGYSNDEIKGKKYEDLLKGGVEKLTGQINELKNAGSDEKIKGLNDEITRYKTLSDQYKTDLDKSVADKSDLENNFNGKIKEFKINGLVREAKGKLAFADSASELAKMGFDTLISSKYAFDLDDKDSLIVLTKEGKRVPNKTTSGKYLDINEVLDMELSEAKLKKQNNLDFRKNRIFEQSRPANQISDDKKIRPVNRKAQEAAEKANSYKAN